MAADPPAVKFRPPSPARQHQTESNLLNILREILRYRSWENPTYGARDRLSHHQAFWEKIEIHISGNGSPREADGIETVASGIEIATTEDAVVNVGENDESNTAGA